MNIDVMVNAMTPEVYDRLREAVETGKWPDGTPLSEDQKESSMQVVMLYQARIAHSTEHMTVNEAGEIVHKSKQDFKRDIKAPSDNNTIARFKQDDI